MHSEQINELFTALSKAQADMTNGRATKQNPYLKNSYASIEDIWNEIREPFAKNGLAVTQLQEVIDSRTYVVTMLCHSSGQWIKSNTPLIIPQNGKNPMQDLGSAITYAKRYGLASIVGFSVSDASDDDGSACKAKTITVSQKIEIEEKMDMFPDTRHSVMQAVGNDLNTMTVDFYNTLLTRYKKLEQERFNATN
jgi:hypothetical protein